MSDDDLRSEFIARRNQYDTAADLIADMAGERGIDLDNDEALARFRSQVRAAIDGAPEATA